MFFLGHGGRQIVDFLEEELEKNVAIELKQTDDASVLDRLARYVEFRNQNVMAWFLSWESRDEVRNLRNLW